MNVIESQTVATIDLFSLLCVYSTNRKEILYMSCIDLVVYRNLSKFFTLKQL